MMWRGKVDEESCSSRTKERLFHLQLSEVASPTPTRTVCAEPERERSVIATGELEDRQMDI
jgi:hypothetical protein